MSSAKHKPTVFLSLAVALGSLSTCDRAKIGAILTYKGRAIAWGYNGAPPKMPHCDENNHGWGPELLAGKYITVGGKMLNVMDEGLYDPEADDFNDDPIGQIGRRAVAKYGCVNAIHAEVNGIAFAARQGISTEGATLYVSQSPCLKCAQLIIAAGIERVVFAEEYRDRTGLELLERAGVG